ncbi:hypothetical protein DFH29DRAFT_1054643 [Suillus ampliporus]|nr:hypothetical protein DFH29DRAFT_1054643 [Suillus ampliporus]
MDLSKKTLVVGGLVVDVYSHPSVTDPNIPIHALFFLHGRYGSTQHRDVVTTVKAIFDVNYKSADGASPRTKDLIIIAFDHRNHGTRLVNQHHNSRWRENPVKNNDQHAADMYANQTGSAQDVSFLIDHLPSFLYPSGERTIVEWGMGGVSLGGHSTWIALSRGTHSSSIGILIYKSPISCQSLVLNVVRKYPSSLRTTQTRSEPTWMRMIPLRFPYRAKDQSNPFLGRKILVLSGAKDTTVPWVASAEFVENLEVGEGGIKRVVLEEGAGHECTPHMQREAGAFVKEWLN